MKKGLPAPGVQMQQVGSEVIEEEIGEEPVEFDHDSGGDGEPDRRKNWSGGQEFLHRCRGSEGKRGIAGQRGETVILLSASVSLPLVSSLKAASGQVAAAKVLLNARGRSIWISCIWASLR